METLSNIRSCFLEYFSRKQHKIVPSGSLVPENDPSLLFTNAGMVQFKNIFTGLENPRWPRVVTAQKCIRAGGKHNDLDAVGYTERHHTFFEMLGNFSFGEYFKEEAIFFAWEFLTKELALSPDKLVITIFHDDKEAFALWQKIAGLKADRIIPIASSDNFWSMGDVGPCGPCSEIFYDHGPNVPGGLPGTVEQEGPRYTEIWNLVFMQFESLKDGRQIALPKPSIDTGMGLERISAVLQGVFDNYETDLFKRLIQASEELTKVKAEGQAMVSHRILADHLRSCSFLIADGVVPSNEGRGYVLRRIMRRAIRHIKLLGHNEALLYRFVPNLVAEMGAAYPELVQSQNMISNLIKEEEERFGQTLARGLQLLEEESAHLQKGQQLAGDIAFKLYDTYGFPLDLTQDALRAREIGVDIAGFDKAMARQKAEGRANWVGSGDAGEEVNWDGLLEKYGATAFLGYESDSANAVIKAILRSQSPQQDGQAAQEITAEISGDMEAIIITDQTPFYAEAGGQIADQGFISHDQGCFAVTDTLKKARKLYIHKGKMVSGRLAVGDRVAMAIDKSRRAKLRANHSATHLLHAALRAELGDMIAPKGSLVTDQRLRFDFYHNKPVTAQEISAIEARINEVILANCPVRTEIMALEEAKALGACAYFTNKYDDLVRVVFIGSPRQLNSIELCGGTHVGHSGDIGSFIIIHERGVAAGIRRIEALTGEAARHYLQNQAKMLADIAQIVKVPIEETYERVFAMQEEYKELERKYKLLQNQMNMARNADKEPDCVINGVKFISHLLSNSSIRQLRNLADKAKRELESTISVFINTDESQKASIVIALTEDLKGRYDAVALVKIAAVALGGAGGGGRWDMAQGGGPLGDQAAAAIAAIQKSL